MNDRYTTLNPKDGLLLGRELFKVDRLDEAFEVFAAVANEDPSSYDAAYQAAYTLSALKRYPEALAWYDRAGDVGLSWWNELALNRAQVLGEMGRSEEAINQLNGLLQRQPDHYHALYNRGVVKMQIDDFAGGLADFERSLAINPDTANGDARFCRGFANLVLGNYTAGFHDFEHRLKANVRGGPAQGVELRPEHVYAYGDDYGHFNPASVQDKTVLVLSEMGRGDMIQFGRYLPMLVELGATVLVVADRGTEPLFRDLPGVTVFAPTDVLPAADYWCHMMGLAYVFQTTADTVPPPMPLTYDPALLAKWRELIPKDNGVLNVGLCWAGSPISRYDEHRTIPLAMMKPIVDLMNECPVRFYGLQQEIRPTDVRYDLAIANIGHRFTDFRQTAHALKCLDLVITVDTSVAHMAGTVGVPTWVLLTKFRTYWLWIKGMATTPWYPSFSLIRQPVHGDWASIVAVVRERLLELLATR